MHDFSGVAKEHAHALELYIALSYGDRRVPRAIAYEFVQTFGLFSEELARLFEESVRKTREERARFQQTFIEREVRSKAEWRELQRKNKRREELAVRLGWRCNDADSRLTRAGNPSGVIRRQDDLWYPPNIYTQFVWWQRFWYLQKALAPFRQARFDRKRGSLGVGEDVGKFIANLIESVGLVDKYKLRRFVGHVEYKYEYYMQYFKPRTVKALQQFLSDYQEAALVILALLDCAGRGSLSRDSTRFEFPHIEGIDPIDLWRMLEEIRRFMADILRNRTFLETFGKYFEKPRLYESDNEKGLAEEGFRLSVFQSPIYERIEKSKDVLDLKQWVCGTLWNWFEVRFKDEAATWRRLDECARHYLLYRAAFHWRYNEEWALWFSQAAYEKPVGPVCELPASCPENEALVEALVELGRAAQATQDKSEDEKEAAKELASIEERCAEEMERISYSPPALLAPRVLSLGEIEAIKQACAVSLSQADAETQGVVATIDEFVAFCGLLRRPENHILVPSGQYIEKQINTRTEQDMVNEMARELIELPRFSAYAKVHQERDGVQSVWKGRVQTIKLDRLEDAEAVRVRNGAIVSHTSQPYLKRRTAIEEEIRLRQERWREVGERGKPPQVIETETGQLAAVAPETSEAEQPPPSHTPM